MKKDLRFPKILYHLTRIALVQACAVVIFASVSFAGTTDSQDLLNRKVSLKVENQNVIGILNSLEKQADVKFTYRPKLVSGTKKYSLEINNERLADVLDNLLIPLKIKYRIIGKQIVLAPIPLSSNLTETQFLANTDAQKSVLKISGKVISAKDGTAMPGVNVLLKGSQVGTTTDVSGAYSIDVTGDNPVLIFSYIGFNPQEVPVLKQSVIDISLVESVETLKEAVVTALGIKREKRSLGYSVGNIEGTALTQTPQNNVLNAMAGKVAGVQISQMGGGVGSSVSMIIRGASSLNGDNQPLFVIDGVPVANKLGNGFGGADMGNAISDINPNDIANVSILKGASAAALYGSRAGNGVVLITTKSGAAGKKGIGVSLNTAVTFDIPLQYIHVQNKFGSGKTGAHVLEEQENESWGAALDKGELWAQWNTKGVKTPLISHPDRFKDFFQTGVTNTNNISVNGNYDKGNFRLSLGNMTNKGIIPTMNLSRLTVALNTAYNITDKLKASFNLNITESGSDNRPLIDASRNDPVRSIYETGAQVDINDLRDYWLPGQEGIAQRKYKDKQNNPFYLVHENPTGFKRDRTVSKIQLDYNLSKEFSVTARYARDAYNELFEAKKAFNNFEYVNGAYNIKNTFTKESNLDLIVAYKKNIGVNWSLNAMAGGNRLQQYGRTLENNAGSLVVPGLYNIANGAPGTVTYSSGLTKKLLYGAYGSASLGFKEMVYLDLTARNDWTSTLPKGNNSYFYPSASLSVLISEMVNLPSWMSFAKVRAGYAQVGNDVAPYNLIQTYATAADWGTAKRMYMAGTLKNANLKPEIATSMEVGFDVKFLKNRLGLEATYYDRKNKNQILGISVPDESGATSKLINAGLVQSKGFEIGIMTTPVKTENLTFDLNVTLSRNRAYIRELADGITYFATNESSGAMVRTYTGGQIGDIYEQPILKVEDKNSPYYNYPIVTAGGLYQNNTDITKIRKIGNFNNKFLMGFQPTVTYKNFTLFANIDWRQGGSFYSNTMMFLGNNGQREETLTGVPYDASQSLSDQIKANPDKYLGNWIGGRNAEYHGMAWPEGSTESKVRVQDASLEPGVFATKNAAGETVYTENLGGAGSKWLDPFSAYRYANRPFPNRNMYSATYVKLREVSISYRLPRAFVNKFKIQNASIAVVGNNLYMWTKAGIKGFDPEKAFQQNSTTGSWTQGIEYYNIMPFTGSLGFKLNVDF
ncbi:SusC/RagA family TonB-linked outer membrane protein [Dyadobacter subterraneus]|uniref:SusC/RagA family TonB-linked outer membrane protein n=1 Tax=Dyadobacter subterraneus TaxID=2773304 RepID=A0ABR9WL74_9BACT|nr:SusC/RagA family TonB-linked outer membrane protein [Dyadobacter subterraneus]MBE9466098.1 SusC/RagA family TonB-linked outer membrane protein [Dyadobacter subterraneus]